MAATRLPVWTRPSFTWMDQAPRLDSARDQRPLDPVFDAAAVSAGQGSGLLVRLAVFDRDLAAGQIGQISWNVSVYPPN